MRGQLNVLSNCRHEIPQIAATQNERRRQPRENSRHLQPVSVRRLGGRTRGGPERAVPLIGEELRDVGVVRVGHDVFLSSARTLCPSRLAYPAHVSTHTHTSNQKDFHHNRTFLATVRLSTKEHTISR